MKTKPKFKYFRWAISLLFLGMALYLVLILKGYFSSTKSSEILGFLGRSPKVWNWCPNPVKIYTLSNKIKYLNQSDLTFLCKVIPFPATPEGVESLKVGDLLFQVEGNPQKYTEIRSNSDYSAFEIGGLPFENPEWTQFFRERTKEPSP